jgi:hypothetical protein
VGGYHHGVERALVDCPGCGSIVVDVVSLSQNRYLVEPQPIEPGVSDDAVIFVSPTGTIRRAIPGDQCEKFRLHRCCLD